MTELSENDLLTLELKYKDNPEVLQLIEALKDAYYLISELQERIRGFC